MSLTVARCRTSAPLRTAPAGPRWHRDAERSPVSEPVAARADALSADTALSTAPRPSPSAPAERRSAGRPIGARPDPPAAFPSVPGSTGVDRRRRVGRRRRGRVGVARRRRASPGRSARWPRRPCRLSPTTLTALPPTVTGTSRPIGSWMHREAAVTGRCRAHRHFHQCRRSQSRPSSRNRNSTSHPARSPRYRPPSPAPQRRSATCAPLRMPSLPVVVAGPAALAPVPLPAAVDEPELDESPSTLTALPPAVTGTAASTGA